MRLARRRAARLHLGAIALAAALAVLALPAPAGAAIASSSTALTPPAAGPVLWSPPAAIGNRPLEAVACPTSTLCVAVDHQGQVFSSTDPAAGAGTWRMAVVDGGADMTAIACPSSALCVATDGSGNAVTSTDPAGGPSAWTVSRIDTSSIQPNSDGGGPALLRGIACPSSTLCVAVDAAGNALLSSNPAAGPSAWSSVHIDGNSSPGCAQAGTSCQPPLMGVACSSTALCDAVDFSGNVLQTNSPTGSSPWTTRPAPGGGISSLWGLACPTQSLCLATDGYGGRVISWNPQLPSVLRSQALPYGLFGIWCPERSLCLASVSTGGGTSALLGSSDPWASMPRWRLSPLGGVNGLACPSPLLCVAVDGAGDVAQGAGTVALGQVLVRQLLTIHHPPTINALLRRGRYLERFTSPIAGTVELDWTVPAPVSGAAPTTVAAASVSFPGPGTRAVPLTLTGAGRALLGGASRARVTATATFATATGSVRRSRRLTLKAVRRHRRPGRRRRR